MGHALKAEFTSNPDDGELLRQFLMQEIQKGWSHSDKIPNLRSAAVGFERIRSRHTLQSISWLCFNASRCFCIFSHFLICSSLSWGLKGCKQCFPQEEHKSPWMWGHFSPCGQLPAAAKEQIDWSAGFRLFNFTFFLSSSKSRGPGFWFHAGFLGQLTGLLEFECSVVILGPRPIPLTTVSYFTGIGSDLESECWRASTEEDGAEDCNCEILTCSYLHLLPYAQIPFW